MIVRIVPCGESNRNDTHRLIRAWGNALLLTWMVCQMSAPAQSNATPDKISATQSVAPRQLHAGPVSLKFEDGELRYLYVGQREIVRRIYFAVRDGNWNTAMPKFTSVSVDDGGDHFSIKLAATCKLDKVDYQWTATITGASDGKITFDATGVPNADFASNRIGLCVLYGAPSLKGQAFETLEDAKRPPKKAAFPQLVLNKLVAERFQMLRYTTADGMQVCCSVAGATFDMEDQRNWGDSSYKAYAPLPYNYPNVKRGNKQHQTLTLTLTNPPALPPIDASLFHLKLTDATIGKIPKFVPGTQFRNAVAFQDISFARERFKGAKVVIWLYTPTVHLPDNDVIMENISAICDQAKTVKDFSPDASLHVGAALRSPKTNEGRDARAATPFGAAWTVSLLKYLACGNVDETAFDLGPGYATQLIDAVRPLSGREIADVQVTPHLPLHPMAFAVKDENATIIFLANRTPVQAKTVLEGLGGASHAKVTVIDAHAKADVPAVEEEVDVKDGTILVDLGAYGTARVVVAK